MTKTPKDPDHPVDAALRKAFEAVEARAVPPDLIEHIETLSALKTRPDRRS